jgi:hypothetical protein
VLALLALGAGDGASLVSALVVSDADDELALGLATGGAFAAGAAQPTIPTDGGAPPTINADAANAYG